MCVVKNCEGYSGTGYAKNYIHWEVFMFAWWVVFEWRKRFRLATNLLKTLRTYHATWRAIPGDYCSKVNMWPSACLQTAAQENCYSFFLFALNPRYEKKIRSPFLTRICIRDSPAIWRYSSSMLACQCWQSEGPHATLSNHPWAPHPACLPTDSNYCQFNVFSVDLDAIKYS